MDIEDRNFHWETKRNGGAEHHFSANTRALPALSIPPVKIQSLPDQGETSIAAEQFIGFAFTPAADRSLRVVINNGLYHPQPEWCENIPHPVEQSRGQTGSGDAFSPGWFEIPLSKGASGTLIVTAEAVETEAQILASAGRQDGPFIADNAAGSGFVAAEQRPEIRKDFSGRLLDAIRAFVVKRGTGKTVIAGYPWFLDWGRDTFIAARGLLAAGMTQDVQQLLLTFGRFERDGTLPNTIFGEDASNRDTSDAPLWFGLVCEELKADLEVLCPVPGRSLRSVLESIAANYIKGTPNGIRVDPASGLVWSPSHFTWMDTNYPAGTPREGYPIEIQALWIRLLRYLTILAKASERDQWRTLAAQAHASLEKFFWCEEKGYYADVLLVGGRRPAREATVR